MSIDQKYKMELLGMISAIGFAHEKELSTNLAEVGTDLISRQAALDTFNTNLNELVVGGEKNAKTVENYLNGVLDKIKCLPSAEPQRMRAKWIATTALQEGQITWRDYKCSNCSHHRGKPMNFCEVCGAKMER